MSGRFAPLPAGCPPAQAEVLRDLRQLIGQRTTLRGLERRLAEQPGERHDGTSHGALSKMLSGAPGQRVDADIVRRIALVCLSAGRPPGDRGVARDVAEWRRRAAELDSDPEVRMWWAFNRLKPGPDERELVRETGIALGIPRLRPAPGPHEPLGSYLADELVLCKNLYREHGRPWLLLERVTQLSEALMRREHDSAWRSLEFAGLWTFWGSVLLDTGGGASEMEQASQLLGRARGVLNRLTSTTESEQRLRVDNYLVGAVVEKARGDRDGARALLDDGLHEARRAENVRDATIEPLRRQQSLLSEDPHQLVRRMAQAADLGADDHGRGEAFATVKRGVEGRMNLLSAGEPDEGGLRLLRQDMMLYRDLHESVARLPLLARISFRKNDGQYSLVTGDRVRAVRLLRQCLEAAALHGFEGQVRQAARLLHAGLHPDDAADRRLPTFLARSEAEPQVDTERLLDEARAFTVTFRK